jgi:transposase
MQRLVDDLAQVENAWRMLPCEYPPWSTVHDCFRHWRKDGTWERIHAQIREQVRVASDRNATPSGAILDSQSIKTTEKGALLDRQQLATTLTRRSRAVSVTS